MTFFVTIAPCLLAFVIATCDRIATLRSEPMMSEPSPIFYRFRSTTALLGEHQELARREIYFASQDELNDPLEGYANVVWQGDAILWRNLLRHYLLVLCDMVAYTAVIGDAFDEAHVRRTAAIVEASLPDAPIRSMYSEICRRFFENGVATQWIEGLSVRSAVLSREELAGFLRILHVHALNVVLHVFEEAGTRTFLGGLNLSEKEPGMAEQLPIWLALLDEAEDRRAVFQSIFDKMSLQMDLVNDFVLAISPAKRGWVFLLKDFPAAYVRALEGLLYPEWRTACFVRKPTHASMWGVYADGHKGVCLGFRSQAGADGEPVMQLHGAFGHKFDSTVTRPWFTSHVLPFAPVRYDTVYPPTDFFRSLGRLTRSALAGFWYCDEDGGRSARIADILAEDPDWRDAYWARAGAIVSTKLSHWSHEEEHRLVAEGRRDSPEERKFRYRLEDLEGVIFGIRTSHADKHEIIRLLAASAAREGVGADTIQFSQAAFSRAKGCIEIQTLSLLTSQFPKLVEAYAGMPEFRPTPDLSALLRPEGDRPADQP